MYSNAVNITKIKKDFKIKYIPELALFLTALFINESYLFLIPRGIHYSITQDLLLMWGFYVYIKYCALNRKKYRYGRVVLLIMALLVISMFKAYAVNNEPLIFALEETRPMFTILLYFPIKALVQKYGYERVVLTVVRFSDFVSVLLIIQWVIYPKFIFLNTESGARFGHYRTYYFLALTIFALLFYMSKFITEKKISWNVCLRFALNLFAFIFVQQTKSAMAAVVGSCMIVFLFELNKGKLINKISFILLCMVFLFFAKDHAFKLYTEAIHALREAATSITGNLGIRIKAVKFMLDAIEDNFLFGLGYYSGLWSRSDYITGWVYGYAFGDVGFFGYIFHLGYVGLTVSIYYLIKLAKNIFEINKNSKYACFGKLLLLYFIFISCFNYYFATSNLLFYLVVYTSIFENIVAKEKFPYEQSCRTN